MVTRALDTRSSWVIIPLGFPLFVTRSLRNPLSFIISIALRTGVVSSTDTSGDDIIFLASTWAASRSSATILYKISRSVIMPTGTPFWVTKTHPVACSLINFEASQAVLLMSIEMSPLLMQLPTGSSRGLFASVQSIQKETPALQFRQLSGGDSCSYTKPQR